MLELVWVPDHKGINIKEKTDLIAKSAVNEGESIDIKLNVKDALREIKQLLESNWDEDYKNKCTIKGSNLINKTMAP